MPRQMKLVTCSLCGLPGGTLRRVGRKKSGTYLHMECLIKNETKLLSKKNLDKLNAMIRGEDATNTV